MKRIYLSSISIILLVFTLTVGSLAWINISNITLVEGIFLEAGSGDLLELSLDGINYEKNLNKSQMQKKLEKLEFKAITTTDNKNFYLNPYESNEGRAVANKDYISIDIYFRITPEYGFSDDEIFKDIYLVNRTYPTYENKDNQKGTFITSKGKTWTSDKTFKVSEQDTVLKNESRTYYAKNAMRIGVVADSMNKFIYDVSEKNQYGSIYGAFDYYNSKSNQSLTVPIKRPEQEITQLTKVNPYTQKADNNNSHIITLSKNNTYYEGKATLNIWLEGWDKDALDAVLNDKVVIQLEFKAGYKQEK